MENLRRLSPFTFYIALILLGLVSICALPIWARYILRTQPSLDSLTIKSIASAFEEDPSIPNEEYRIKYNRAKFLLDSYLEALGKSRKHKHWADWAAFALTSTITILAGYLGINGSIPAAMDNPESSGPTKQKKSPAHARRQRSDLQASRRRKRFATIMGVLAALASTSTALSSRLDLQVEKQSKTTLDLNSNLSSIRAAWNEASTKEKALEIIGRLDALLLTSPPD